MMGSCVVMVKGMGGVANYWGSSNDKLRPGKLESLAELSDF
jgi:hypothetical protein